MVLPGHRDHNFQTDRELSRYFVDGQFDRERMEALRRILAAFDPSQGGSLPEEIVQHVGPKRLFSITADGITLDKKTIAAVPWLGHLHDAKGDHGCYLVVYQGVTYVYDAFGRPMPECTKREIPAADDPEIERALAGVDEEMEQLLGKRK